MTNNSQPFNSPSRPAVTQSHLPGMTPRQGKVRDVYDFGNQLLFVATDRISAFDWILPTGIPDKGKLLTQMSCFWFDLLKVRHHLVSTNPATLPLPAGTDLSLLEGRSLVVQKTRVIPIECVVRGYLAGSGWKEYRASQTICGISLPPGLVECDKLPVPIFTPATKAESGHDENISFEQMQRDIDPQLAEKLRDLSLSIYRQAADYALKKGIVLADTKFEFGLLGEEIILIDEVLTPDSSRFWPLDQYRPGHGQPSFDKQFVRDWLETQPWDKNSPPPPLPEDVVLQTRAKYVEAYERLTGSTFS
ncbi:phosphoribosylaminoimidazole-succinocarboxamide synthase [Planctopirus limnophila DSM 3776]|uniref:Phosphoribosylaminoimidazole-succinocarboxamide synthase n=1 Tax=Planctopirus limnophila (strain ATCC 43296 / DSM 3776 / IFAM 1008 / Mu 290) TaxID=521674 RepID=D5SX38_PLAL2|nr:phosphoribosylaminoimidazolesuccinocarboxamide synthase [Planctopirus limnophila]ADG69660.1 phosphoribosylaminoimidazole-succinocarboxamide synthase [Planctopirus limnophila DSM 3776]